MRSYIKNDLNLPDKEHVEVERVHRVKSRDPSKCTTVVKFNKFKDRDCVIDRAKSQLTRDSNLSAKPDYTDRFVRHRRELGHRMTEERQKNNYAAMSYDKLIVNDQVYKYDDLTKSIVCIGRRHTAQPRGQWQHGQNINNNIRRLDEGDHVDDDDITGQGGDWNTSVFRLG